MYRDHWIYNLLRFYYAVKYYRLQYLQLDTKFIQKYERLLFLCVAIKPGHHPVKRRGVTSVTKCHKCNGTGIIFIGKYHFFR